MWRNGVYDYLHYHATVHEALGVARGHARVQFGGDRGKALDISAGDVAILPAGTGHQLISASEDFCVVGAYPPGPPMQITRPTPENHAKALKTIPEVKLPKTDPVRGEDGPLVRLWKQRWARKPRHWGPAIRLRSSQRRLIGTVHHRPGFCVAAFRAFERALLQTFRPF